MTLTSLEKHKLKKFIRTLEKIRGRHTELVSVYIPSGYDLNKIINHVFQEQGTASNIKDKTTRKHVIDSLEKMIRHLRLFKATPQMDWLYLQETRLKKKESRSYRHGQ